MLKNPITNIHSVVFGLLESEGVPRMLQLENRASEGIMTGVLNSLAVDEGEEDLVLVCSDQEVVKSHRQLLGLWSPVLRPLLGLEASLGLGGSQPSLLLLPGFTCRAVEGVLSLLQGGWGEDTSFTLSQEQVDLLASLGVHPGSMEKFPARKVAVACHVCGRKVLDLTGHMQLLHRDYEPPSERAAETESISKYNKEDSQKDNSFFNEKKRKPVQEAFVGEIKSILKSKPFPEIEHKYAKSLKHQPINEAYLLNSVFEPYRDAEETTIGCLETVVENDYSHIADDVMNTSKLNMIMEATYKSSYKTAVKDNFSEMAQEDFQNPLLENNCSQMEEDLDIITVDVNEDPTVVENDNTQMAFEFGSLFNCTMCEMFWKLEPTNDFREILTLHYLDTHLRIAVRKYFKRNLKQFSPNTQYNCTICYKKLSSSYRAFHMYQRHEFKKEEIQYFITQVMKLNREEDPHSTGIMFKVSPNDGPELEISKICEIVTENNSPKEETKTDYATTNPVDRTGEEPSLLKRKVTKTQSQLKHSNQIKAGPTENERIETDMKSNPSHTKPQLNGSIQGGKCEEMIQSKSTKEETKTVDTIIHHKGGASKNLLEVADEEYEMIETDMKSKVFKRKSTKNILKEIYRSDRNSVQIKTINSNKKRQAKTKNIETYTRSTQGVATIVPEVPTTTHVPVVTATPQVLVVPATGLDLNMENASPAPRNSLSDMNISQSDAIGRGTKLVQMFYQNPVDGSKTRFRPVLVTRDEEVRVEFDLVSTVKCKPFIYKARESSLVPEGFLAAQLLQKM